MTTLSAGGESKQGLGVYAYPGGATYEGEWNNNVKDGVGVYKWPKGGSYAGEFRRGTFNGMGLRFMRSGAIKSGRFEEGVGLHSLPGVRLVTWNVLAVINWCFDCKIT